MNLPKFFSPIIKTGVKSGIAKWVQYTEKFLDVIRSYHPIGTFYFMAGKDCDEPFVTRNQAVIEELLGFIPPHKIVTSDGQELRVSHYSTPLDGDKQASRFSLKTVTEVTLSNKVNVKSAEDEESKSNILDLLVERSNSDEGTMSGSSVYVAVPDSNAYRTRKLSEQGWIMLMSNHMIEEYISSVLAKTQPKISKYPMLAPKNVETINHFGVKPKSEKTELTEEFKEAIYASANILKSTGKTVWNQAKDELLKKKMGQKKNPQVARMESVPTVTRNPLFQSQSAYYAQQGQQQKQNQGSGLYPSLSKSLK